MDAACKILDRELLHCEWEVIIITIMILDSAVLWILQILIVSEVQTCIKLRKLWLHVLNHKALLTLS